MTEQENIYADENGNEINLYKTLDALVWAKQFCALDPEADLSLIHCWFCNIMMTGWDLAHQRVDGQTARLRKIEAAAKDFMSSSSLSKTHELVWLVDLSIGSTDYKNLKESLEEK